MLKIFEKYFVKKSEYDLLFETHQELIENYQEKELRVHVLEEKVKALNNTLKEADDTIKSLKEAVVDLTFKLDETKSKPKKGIAKTKPVVVKKEVKKDGNKKEESNEKPVSKRGRPRKSTNN